MSQRPLFRKEVLEKKINTNYGTVSINLPIRYSVIAVSLTLFIVALIIFVAKGEISEKYTVRGYINPEKGIANIYPFKDGVILKQAVSLGDVVHEGDVLFIIDSSIYPADNSNDNATINNLLLQQNTISNEIALKNEKVSSLKKLLDNQYVPLTTYNDAYQELLELKNNKYELELEIVKYNQDKSFSLRSPSDGVVTNILHTAGQFAQQNRSLAQIMALDSTLVAELYVPVEQSGFIKIGDQILIYYDAYPHARFGSYKATIEEISKTILTDNDESTPIAIGGPYYKVRARLQQISVNLYGSKKNLQQGMTFSAVIVGPKRTILQWILDPLFSFYGSMFV